MKTNFLADFDRVLEELPVEKPTLLLHSCCGPCSTSVLETLCPHFDVTIYFYNPNILSVEEYEKRLFWQRETIRRMGLPVHLLEGEYRQTDFLEAAAGLLSEPEGGSRCTVCFRMRLEKTAHMAAECGFSWFCTTLTVSPHKDAGRVNRLGQELGRQHGVNWLPSDFKKRDGYRRSVELCRTHGIYRQNYCGCGLPVRGEPDVSAEKYAEKRAF